MSLLLLVILLFSEASFGDKATKEAKQLDADIQEAFNNEEKGDFILPNGTNHNQVKFLIIGDWGGENDSIPVTKVQQAVADAMGIVGEALNPDFVVSVGDNFYSGGVYGVTDTRFNTSWNDVYTHTSLQKRWYIVAGNRDYYGNVTAQIEYTKLSDKWYFPSHTYDQIIPIPGTNKTIHMLFLDTWDLTTQSRTNPGLAPPNFTRGNSYLDFLKTKLSKSTSTWKFLTSHYPVYSAGAHGPFDIHLKASIEPLLHEYNIDAYFCGHDHSEQHLIVNGKNYFVFGGGSDVSHNWSAIPGLPTNDTLKFRFPLVKSDGGGFGSVVVDENSAYIQIWNSKAENIYRYTISKGGNKTGTPPDTIEPTTGTTEPIPPKKDKKAKKVKKAKKPKKAKKEKKHKESKQEKKEEKKEKKEQENDLWINGGTSLSLSISLFLSLSIFFFLF